MPDVQGAMQRWREYRPSKVAWFWSCVASVVLTIIVGFTWGGWVTGGTAKEMAKSAAGGARAELAAAVCADRFLHASDARAQLTAFKKENTWNRDSFLEKGGWVTLAGLEEPVEGAADLCAERLADAEVPPAADADTAAVGPETASPDDAATSVE